MEEPKILYNQRPNDGPWTGASLGVMCITHPSLLLSSLLFRGSGDGDNLCFGNYRSEVWMPHRDGG